MQDIKNKIIELFQIKKSRYITQQYIKKIYGEEFGNNTCNYKNFVI
jgi:hypothetical protein